MNIDLNLELSKILAKTMQSSYKKSEIKNTITRIINKLERGVSEKCNQEKIIKLRSEVEEIRKKIYGLK